MTTSNSSKSPSKISQFFFAEEVPYGMALARIFLPLVLLIVIVQRWPDAREIYSADGAPASLWTHYGMASPLPELPGSVAVALFSVLGISLICSSLGWYTRISLVISMVLYLYFNLMDCISTITKYSVIASHAMLCLSLSRCGDVWSIDAWRRKREQPATSLGDLSQINLLKSSAWPRRCLQLLIGYVYFGAAITKMHTPAYFNGDQLMYWMMTNYNFSHMLGEYLTLVPSILVLFAYVAIVWEVLFIFLCWRGWGRLFMLSLGVTFHLMTSLTLGLYIFPLVCYCTYFSFVGEADWNRFFDWFAGRKDKFQFLVTPISALRERTQWAFERMAQWPVPSWAGFASLLVCVAVFGVEAEYHLDPYGLRAEDTTHELKELNPVRVAEMLKTSTPMNVKDTVFAFDIGTTFIGGTLVDRRSSFRQGEQIHAQCLLQPPHADLFFEVNLHDAEDRVIEEIGQVVPREASRANWFYVLTESYSTGTYYLVLKSAGREIARQQFELQPARGSVLGN